MRARLAAACSNWLVRTPDPSQARAAGSAGSSSALPNAAKTMPPMTSTPAKPPPTAGNVDRIANPRPRPAGAQTQIPDILQRAREAVQAQRAVECLADQLIGKVGMIVIP